MAKITLDHVVATILTSKIVDGFCEDLQDVVFENEWLKVDHGKVFLWGVRIHHWHAGIGLVLTGMVVDKKIVKIPALILGAGMLISDYKDIADAIKKFVNKIKSA